MIGIYVLAAVIGGGLLLFSMLAGDSDGGHDLGGAEVDVGGAELDAAGLDLDASGVEVDVDASGAEVDPDLGQGQGLSAADLVLGLFQPRNLIFFAAAFGLTGMLLTLVGGTGEAETMGLSLGMGAGAMTMTHLLFTWLRRSESAVDALAEIELEGRTGRVVLPLAPGQPGRIACLVADREIYLNARLASDAGGEVGVGGEVVVVRTEKGVAEVVPFDSLELPPG